MQYSDKQVYATEHNCICLQKVLNLLNNTVVVYVSPAHWPEMSVYVCVGDVLVWGLGCASSVVAKYCLQFTDQNFSEGSNSFCYLFASHETHGRDAQWHHPEQLNHGILTHTGIWGKKHLSAPSKLYYNCSPFTSDNPKVKCHACKQKLKNSNYVHIDTQHH